MPNNKIYKKATDEEARLFEAMCKDFNCDHGDDSKNESENNSTEQTTRFTRDKRKSSLIRACCGIRKIN